MTSMYLINGLLMRTCDCGQANLPKEIADYLNKMGARIPNIKPGKATIEYLSKVQASTRFWGMLLVQAVVLASFMCLCQFEFYIAS